jgi:hypothetical protein
VRKREEKKRRKEKEAGHVNIPPGTMLKTYEVVKFIADGTFGRVVEAKKDGRRYALKVIRPVERYTESAEMEA